MLRQRSWKPDAGFNSVRGDSTRNRQSRESSVPRSRKPRYTTSADLPFDDPQSEILVLVQRLEGVGIPGRNPDGPSRSFSSKPVLHICLELPRAHHSPADLSWTSIVALKSPPRQSSACEVFRPRGLAMRKLISIRLRPCVHWRSPGGRSRASILYIYCGSYV